jgi:hypothetical protein
MQHYYGVLISWGFFLRGKIFFMSVSHGNALNVETDIKNIFPRKKNPHDIKTP